MNELKVIPTYEVVDKKYDLDKDSVTIVLVNLTNDFDVIKIEVSGEVNDVVNYSSYYSIATRTKRTWYTLWLGKKEEYHVLGNIDDEGKVMITVNTEPLSDEAIENLKKEREREKL